MLAERTLVEFCGFPEKLEARSWGRRGERRAAFWKKALSALSAPHRCDTRKWALPENLPCFFSSSESQWSGKVKGLGNKAGERFLELRHSVGNRTYQQSLGFG